MIRFTEMFTELVRVEIELWNGLEAHLVQTAGMTLAQYQALAAIKANGVSSRVQDISRELSITVGATSKVVDRLERDGYASRSAHPTDRRSSLVFVSETGKVAFAKADAAAEAHLQALLSTKFTGQQLPTFLAQLTSMRAGSAVAATR